MKTLTFFLLSLTLSFTSITSAQTVVFYVNEEEAILEFQADLAPVFEEEWMTLVQTLEAEMQQMGLTEHIACCPVPRATQDQYFVFMGEAFPSIDPSMQPQVDTRAVVNQQTGIRFLGESFPELPAEEMLLPAQADRFTFMNETYPTVQEKDMQLPL